MSTFAMSLSKHAPAPLYRSAYQLMQRGLLWPAASAQRLLRKTMKRPISPDRKAELEVQRRYDALLKQDLANVERGYYPRQLLFQMPLGDYLRRAPALLLDIPKTVRRMGKGDHHDLPAEVSIERYPDYFRRNFHWQTDGYFSRHSAKLYDIGVELLFVGVADVMRRQVIPPISRKVQREGGHLRLLDVACGTGRLLHQLAVAHPHIHYFGLDLSPFYVQHARAELSHLRELSLVAANAEDMPYRDAYFDVLTSVYLFHELPKSVRRNVYQEMWRVLKPGGLLVIQDSAQMSESGDLAFFLGRFSKDFHEPYHRGYVSDDIAAAVAAVGFEVEAIEAHFVAKVVIARKPE